MMMTCHLPVANCIWSDPCSFQASPATAPPPPAPRDLTRPISWTQNMIELSKIRIDGKTQPRAELNQDTIAEYAEAYKSGANLPPVTLFFDGSSYWLADGFHRYNAARDAGRTTIYEEIIPGTLRDAILYSLSANSKHGLRRSNADKKKAVKTLLDDPEWSMWPQAKIAETCGVTREYVNRVCSEFVTCDRSQVSAP